MEKIGDWIWTIHHDDADSWGSFSEILFWIAVLVFHIGVVLYAAWNLAKKHTEATGSSVLVEVKPEKVSSSASGESNLLGGTTMRRKNKGGLSRFWQS